MLLGAALSSCAPTTALNTGQRMMLEPARNAEKGGDFAKAVREYEQAPQGGVAYAQYRLARLHERGLGTAQNEEEAARWYRAASDRGDPAAKIALAKMYEQGRGVAKDEAAALALYLEAAEHERSRAYRLNPPRPAAVAHTRAGQMIEQGRGGPAHPAAAARLYGFAAEAGNPDAQFALAELYWKGRGRGGRSGRGRALGVSRLRRQLRGARERGRCQRPEPARPDVRRRPRRGPGT